MSIDVSGITGAGIPDHEFAAKLRRKRMLSGGMVIAAAISLYASQVTQPVPLYYILGIACIGAVFGFLLAFFGPVRKMWHGLLAGAFFALSTDLVKYLTLPDPSIDPFAVIWPELSAMVIGMSLVMLPFTRKLLLRTAGQSAENETAAAGYRQAGDSRFTAGLRVSAHQLGTRGIVTLIVMGTGMAGFGIFAYALGIPMGLALTVMMIAAVAPFIRMLWLLGEPGRARHGESST